MKTTNETKTLAKKAEYLGYYYATTDGTEQVLSFNDMVEYAKDNYDYGDQTNIFSPFEVLEIEFERLDYDNELATELPKLKATTEEIDFLNYLGVVKQKYATPAKTKGETEMKSATEPKAKTLAKTKSNAKTKTEPKGETEMKKSGVLAYKEKAIAEMKKSAKTSTSSTRVLATANERKQIAKAIEKSDRSALNHLLFNAYKALHPDYKIGKSDSTAFREYITGVMQGKINWETGKEPTPEKPKTKKSNAKAKAEQKSETKKAISVDDVKQKLFDAYMKGEINVVEFTSTISKL